MSDPTAQEPTMEEILASIRRIISEDDAPAAEAPAPAAEAEAPKPAAPPEPPKPAPALHLAPAPEPEPEEDDVLDLTDPEPTPTETHGDLDVFAPPPPPAPKPEPVAASEPPPPKPAPLYEPEPSPLGGSLVEDEPLLGGGAHQAAASHFGRLAQSIAMPASGQTLDAVVRELLRPLLKDWLDEHLPAIVEERVQAEVERVSRRRV